MSYWNRRISVDVDIDDVLEMIDDEEIKEYALSNNIINISDFNICEMCNDESGSIYDILNSIISYCNDEQFYSLLLAYRNRGLPCNIPRSKTEMKEFLEEIINVYCHIN